MHPELIGEHLEALGNHFCTKRALLRGAAFGAAGLGAGELAKVFPDIPSFVLAEGPSLLDTFSSLEKDKKADFLEQHLDIANDAGIESFGRITISSITDIERHVVARHQTASKPEYRDSHCPGDTTSSFLRTVLFEEKLPEGIKVFVQQEMLKGGVKGKEILRFVLPADGSAGIIGYISETGKGTVYTVPDLSKIGTKGREITNSPELAPKMAKLKETFKNDPCKPPPTPQSETAPVSAPASAVEDESLGINPIVWVLGILGTGLVALRTRGQSQNRAPAQI